MTPRSRTRPSRHDRLEPADAALLTLEERTGAPQNVGCVLIFEGGAPTLDELIELVRGRLAGLPRHLSRVIGPRLPAGRPVWANAPDLDLGFHVRREGLPRGDDALERLAARVLASRLDRGRPLWELMLVEDGAPGGFALIVKSHAVLAGGGLVAALLADAPASAMPSPSAAPAHALLLADALTSPSEALYAVRSLAALARRRRRRAPSPLAAPAGPLRRLALMDADLALAQAAKERLGGTVNDVVLAALASALGAHLRARGEDPEGMRLRALVPVASADGGELLAAFAPLPVGTLDARRRHAEIARALDGLRASGRAAGAAELRERDGFAAAALVVDAARMAARERGFDVVVANVPGPQRRHQMLGRELLAAHPVIPLANGRALSVAVLSYRGRLCFGLLADGDALPDPAALARATAGALAELAPQAR